MGICCSGNRVAGAMADTGGCTAPPNFYRQPVSVWGRAAPGEAVKVTLAGKESSTKADADGRWFVKLDALKEGENLALAVTGKNSITFTNIIVGDIWLCSGQSNMEMGLGGCLNAGEDIKAAEFPKIRRIKFNHTTSANPEEDAPAATTWQVCSPKTAGGFTAVGFYFAREISQKTGVPVGILDDNWGGTQIEPWTAPEGMELVAELAKTVADKQRACTNYTHQLPKAMDEMEQWIATTRPALAKGAPLTPSPAMPVHPGAGGWSSIYNAMIKPMIHFPIKGALWYQGESNGSEGDSYYDKMRALIGGWRALWKQGDFSFYFVQLASLGAANENPAGGDGWARLRQAQTKSLTIPHTGMAVIIDTDVDLHPRNKYDVGLRLSRWALVNDYGQKMEVSGPLFREMKVESGKIRLSFDHVGAGLMIGKKTGRDPTVEDKDGKLKRFAIAGADKKWFWADAVIDGATVIVFSPDVKEPVAAHYAFSCNPDGANLYNKDGLPASPFRTDDW
jgi:sialate O-acetylesterase